jgi:hypothetical protein
MHDHFADVARIFQPDICPGLAAIIRTVHAIAKGNIPADAGFSGACVNHIGIRLGNRDGADGGGGLLVKQRIPGDAAVHGLPNSAGDRAHVIRIGLAGHAGDREDSSSAKWADQAPFHRAVKFRVDGRVARIGGVIFLFVVFLLLFLLRVATKSKCGK